VVDGLEHKLRAKMKVVHVDVGDDEGSKTARRFGITMTPTFVLLDGQGRVMHRQVGGSPDVDAITRKVAEATR
jgi:protein-disulfide isomerase